MSDARGPFSLAAPGAGRAPRFASGLVERALGLPRLASIHAARPSGLRPGPLLAFFLRELGIAVEVADADVQRIPAEGPLVVVANHPFGGADGLAVAEVLLRRRDDVAILGNHLLARIPDLRDIIIAVDPFGGADAARGNARGLRRALAHVRAGGALLAFPSGEVAHVSVAAGRVLDPPWSATVAGLARRTGAAMLPVHVPGRNSAAFQVAGLVHPRLRTALLPRELLARRGTTVVVRVGAAVDGEALRAAPSDEAAIAAMRWRCELLSGRSERPAGTGRRSEQAIAEAVPPEALAAELAALPAESTLLESRDDVVLLARQHEAPLALQEIGRLREIAFRAAGEGTGRPRDLDAFDGTYRHLIAFNRARREILGSYRIGAVDELLAAGGRAALYTSTLFDVREDLLAELGPSLELGRSFVRLESQRRPEGLPLLWRGLGALACREPHRPVLLGAVSISASYGETARRLMTAFLRRVHGDPEAARRVRARTPPLRTRAWEDEVAALGNLDEISQLVALADPEGKGMPVLVRQYLKLGARVLGLNVDHAFGGVIDALIVVDLRRVEPRVLEKFMGRDKAARWRIESGASHDAR